jgi:hypothetical protein
MSPIALLDQNEDTDLKVCGPPDTSRPVRAFEAKNVGSVANTEKA